VDIQTFGAELSIEAFDVTVVGWFAWAGEIERHASLRPGLVWCQDKIPPAARIGWAMMSKKEAYKAA